MQFNRYTAAFGSGRPESPRPTLPRTVLARYVLIGLLIPAIIIGTAHAAPKRIYRINNGSASPGSVSPGQTVVITADFRLFRTETVAIYFELRDQGNAIVASHSFNGQVYVGNESRPYTWNFVVPADLAAGTYLVHAGIFAADWSLNLLWEPEVATFDVVVPGDDSTPPDSNTPPDTSTPPDSNTPPDTSTPPDDPSDTSGDVGCATSPCRAFYVDIGSGNDSNSGTSESAAWRSIVKVNGFAFQPGDKVHFKRGGVWTGNLRVSRSGTASSPITYLAYGTGAAPLIKNPGVTYGSAITVTGDYNIVRDFLLREAHEAGLLLQSGADHNVVRNNEITATGFGVLTRGQYNLITNNYVHDLRMIVNDSASWSDYGAVCFWIEAPNNEISYNRGIFCKAPSYDFGYDGGFVEIWQNGDNSYIHHNYARNTNGFFELGGSGSGSARGVRVAYNVIVNVTGPGSGTSVCFNTGSYDITVSSFKFENNTWISNAGHRDAYRVFGCRGDLSALELRNNIFYSDIQIANTGSFTHARNLYYMTNMVNGSGVGYSLGTGERIANPMFTDLGAGVLGLQPASPAVDAGMSLGYARDFEGRAVPLGAAPDIGAYEYDQN